MQPLLEWKSNKYYIFWVCLCNLRYPACNAHAPCCHPWLARLYYNFPQYLINRTIFEEKKRGCWILSVCCGGFSRNFVWHISHSMKNLARYDKKMYACRYVKYPLFLADCDETWALSTDFRKIFQYQISWKSVQWEPCCSMRIDRRTCRS